MKVEFFDRQNVQNPLNGLNIYETSRLSELLDQMQERVPFFSELLGQNGYKLLLGIGGPKGCVQFSRRDGAPPYLMALSHNPDRSVEDISFRIGGELTDVPSQYCIAFETVKRIAEQFLLTGERSPYVSWEEI
jgi:hypothetical protein